MSIIDRAARLFRKTPADGDKVWWSPKGAGGHVAANFRGVVTFQGGPIVKNKRGRQVPRWTVSVNERYMRWDPAIDMWIVGAGPTPKRGSGGIIVYPDPVLMSGESKGSFANG